MSLKKILFVTLCVFLSLPFLAQSRYGQGNYNRLGVTGGVSFFDINTSNFNTESATSFTGGLTTRGSFRNNIDLIYGIGFISNNVRIQASAPSSTINQFITFNTIGATINFQGSYNIIMHHLSIEFGPVLVINSKLKANEAQEEYLISGYSTVTAKDLENISPINANGLVGLTAGLESFKLNLSYQYGFTNFLANLNDRNIEFNDINGNTSTLTVAAIIYF